MTEEELQNRIVHNVRSLRKARRLSQERLADKADISRQMMNDIEGGRRFLSRATLVRLANALEADVHELFLPARGESALMSQTYGLVVKKITEEIRATLNSTIDAIQREELGAGEA